MGVFKGSMEEDEDFGNFKQNNKNICSNHFVDEAIINFIEINNNDASLCSFCKPKYQSESVISFKELMKYLESGINHFYDDASNAGLSYDSSEGGYLGNHFDTFDLINEQIRIDVDDPQIIEEILNRLPITYWCHRNPFEMNKHEVLIYNWERFSNLIKHKIRYSFFRTKEFDSNDKTEVSDILREIALSVDELKLILPINIGTTLYRSRQHGLNETPNSFEELSSPPLKYCKLPNRMSPSGISMFYGAFDSNTAEQEVLDDQSIVKKPLITIVEFILKKDLQIIDLCSLPPIPSIFDEQKRLLFHKTMFLHKFVHEISKKIERDGYEHTEYVPTQVVTEYFRYVVPEIAQYNIDGIIYPSAKENEKKCCVLFFDDKDSKVILELKPNSIKTKNIIL